MNIGILGSGLIVPFRSRSKIKEYNFMNLKKKYSKKEWEAVQRLVLSIFIQIMMNV